MAPWENGCLSIEAHPPPCLPPAKKPAVKVHAGSRSISWLSCWATRLDGHHAGRRPSESWCHRKRGHITWPDKVSFLRDDEGTACSTNSTSGWTKLWRAREKKKETAACFRTNVLRPAPFVQLGPASLKSPPSHLCTPWPDNTTLVGTARIDPYEPDSPSRDRNRGGNPRRPHDLVRLSFRLIVSRHRRHFWTLLTLPKVSATGISTSITSPHCGPASQARSPHPGANKRGTLACALTGTW